jgi:hypothetical protein
MVPRPAEPRRPICRCESSQAQSALASCSPTPQTHLSQSAWFERVARHNGGQRPRVDPVADRLRVELQRRGDLVHGQELIHPTAGNAPAREPWVAKREVKARASRGLCPNKRTAGSCVGLVPRETERSTMLSCRIERQRTTRFSRSALPSRRPLAAARRYAPPHFRHQCECSSPAGRIHRRERWPRAGCPAFRLGGRGPRQSAQGGAELDLARLRGASAPFIQPTFGPSRSPGDRCGPVRRDLGVLRRPVGACGA